MTSEQIFNAKRFTLLQPIFPADNVMNEHQIQCTMHMAHGTSTYRSIRFCSFMLEQFNCLFQQFQIFNY